MFLQMDSCCLSSKENLSSILWEIIFSFIFKHWGLNRQQSRVINPKGKFLCLSLCSLYIQYLPKSFFRHCKSPEWMMNTLAEYIVFLRTTTTTTTTMLKTLKITATLTVHWFLPNMLWKWCNFLCWISYFCAVAIH